MNSFLYLDLSQMTPFSMSRIFPFSFMLFLPFYATVATAQVVNMERARIQSDSTGWLGNAGASFSLIKNTRQVISADADAQMQYKTTRHLYLIAGNFGLLKSAGSKLIGHSLMHLRYNYKIDGTLRWEVFGQWQKNAVTLIQNRLLIGTGPRFKLVSNEKFRWYAGCLLMYEHEREMTMGKPVHNDLRNSSYLSFTFVPTQTLEIVSTTYYQPLLSKIADYRLLNQLLLRMKAGKYWAIRLNWQYLFDKIPADGVPRENYQFSTGFDVDL